MIQNNSGGDILTSCDKKFGNPKTSLSCGLEWLLISNPKKLGKIMLGQEERVK